MSCDICCSLLKGGNILLGLSLIIPKRPMMHLKMSKAAKKRYLSKFNGVHFVPYFITYTSIP